MPIRLVLIAIGVGSFIAGVVASKPIKSRGAPPVDYASAWGEQVRVACHDGQSYDGALQDVGEDSLTLELGTQRFLAIPFEDISGVNVIATL